MSITTEFDKFKDVLFNEKIIGYKMKRVQCKKHKLGRSMLDDRIGTLAYFHKDNATSCKEIKKDCNNEDRDN